MKPRQIIILIFAIINNFIFCQSIFTDNKTFVYDAYFLESNGDTMTVEEIYFRPKNESWLGQKNQKQIEYRYVTDYIGITNFEHPYKGERERIARNTIKAKNRKSWANYTWIDTNEVTGMFENDSAIWLHPPRSNQYVYTYLTLYPQVKLDQLKKSGTWKDSVFIFGAIIPRSKEFKGKVINEVKVIGQTETIIDGKKIENCWIIESEDLHNHLGKSYTKMIFDKNYYGFIRLEFEYYNGKKIILHLKEVKDINKNSY